MIEAIRRLGEIKREELSEKNFKEEFLQELSNPIKTHYEKWKKSKDKNIKSEKESVPIKKVVINLDLEQKEIEISCDEELSNKKQFVFSKTGNIKQIDFNANALKKHIENTIPDLIRFIEEKIPNPKRYEKFINYLEQYKDIFYKNIEKKDKKGKNSYLLNFDLVKDKQECKDFEELILKRLNNITKGEFKKYYRTFFLYLDNKNILDNKFKKDFFEIKYFQLVESFFYVGKDGKGIKEEKHFHLKDKKDQITNNIDILTKFYMTDKNTFFENFKEKNAYKSFSVNQKTYEELLLGINEIWNSLNSYFKGLNYLLIPKSNEFMENLDENISVITDEMKTIQNSKKEYENLKDISEINEWSFDMLFYEKKNSYFNVFKIINDLSYFNLEEISKIISEINNKNDIRNTLNKKYENYRLFDLNQFWNSIYSWTDLTGFKDKKVLYRTEFLEYLDCIYNRRNVKQEKLIKKFLFNLKKYHFGVKDEKKRDLKLKQLILNSFNSLIFLLKLRLIRNNKMEKEQRIFSEKISNEYVKEFCGLYPEVFGDNLENGLEKQGLVLLGYLVNQVIVGQGNKSKNFINKINFDGIKKEKLNLFIIEVIEFLNIYSKKDKPLIKWNNQIILEMQERLINIEKSTFTREEITYYILLGNFFGAYIRIKKGTQEGESNINEDELNNLEEEENDNTE